MEDPGKIHGSLRTNSLDDSSAPIVTGSCRASMGRAPQAPIRQYVEEGAKGREPVPGLDQSDIVPTWMRIEERAAELYMTRFAPASFSPPSIIGPSQSVDNLPRDKRWRSLLAELEHASSLRMIGSSPSIEERRIKFRRRTHTRMVGRYGRCLIGSSSVGPWNR